MSTKELIKSANIKSHDLVLDLACGTGAITKELAPIIHLPGQIVGIDFARGPLTIAKSENASCDFAEMDAEHIGLKAEFDVVFCQYALMFFPEPEKVLLDLKGLLKRKGRLAVAVHGSAEGVPYFSTIMNPILKHIPDIRPANAPNVHRFGKEVDLKRTILSAGFSEVEVKKFVFEYEVGTFNEYWLDYMSSTARSIVPKIEAKGSQVVDKIKREAEGRCKRYTVYDSIIFPWDVLIATAVKT